MRILAANKYYHVRGGSDRYFFDLNELHSAAGHEVIPFAMQHPSNTPTDYSRYFLPEVTYWESPTLRQRIHSAARLLYSTEARSKIRRLIQEHRPDIAHIHLIYHQLSPAFLPILKEHLIPIVQTLHDYKPVCPTYSMVANGGICERCSGKRFFHAALVRCNRGSFAASSLNAVEMYLHHALGWYDLPDVYITPSVFMRNKLIEFGMSATKLLHIPNFVDSRRFPYSQESDRYFVYAGRLVPIKGVKTLLRAMSLNPGIDARLLIVGDGPQRVELEEDARQWGLKTVEFLGYRDRNALKDIVSRAMFTVLPSEVYENCPMAVLESMALGRPVVGARIGGIPELIVEGETGVLFESGNAEQLAEALHRMVQDRARCLAMGRAARARVERLYSPELHYERVMAAYDGVRNGATVGTAQVSSSSGV